MSLRKDAKMIGDQFKEISSMLERNRELLDIQEGNLLTYVEREMAAQLSPSAFEVCRHRVPPINVQKRVVDKLSQIYGKVPTRKLGDTATDQDKEMWNIYLESFKINESGQTLNEYFNLHKSCAWEPYLDNRFQPRLRELPKDRFFVLGMDPTDPLRVTHFIKVMGTASVEKIVDGKTTFEDHVILYCYTDQEFLIIYDNGEVAEDLMAQKQADKNSRGKNPYGVIPFVYANRSKTKINAPQDSDMYRMATMIPLLFGDINYALMFQAFSIWYGINVDAETIPINPNAFINLKATQDSPGVKPEIGVIKPEVDSDKAISAVMEQLSLWLQSRNIRPGTVGKADQSLNGVSKMIDEMDTTGDRQRQIPYFTNAEEQLFYLVAYHLHPVWARNPSFKAKAQFTRDLEYSVKFSDQVSWQTRMEILQECDKEMKMGLLSAESAMARANPEMSPAEREEELEKVRKERESAAALEAKRNPSPAVGE